MVMVGALTDDDEKQYDAANDPWPLALLLWRGWERLLWWWKWWMIGCAQFVSPA